MELTSLIEIEFEREKLKRNFWQTIIVSGAAVVIVGMISAAASVYVSRINTDGELSLKKIEIEHEIELAEQQFVRDILQNTISEGTVKDQIKNLRAYAKISLICQPYAERILSLEKEELPSIDKANLEKVLSDESNNLPVHFLKNLLELSRSVGLVRMRNSFVGHSFATGFITITKYNSGQSKIFLFSMVKITGAACLVLSRHKATPFWRSFKSAV